MVTKTVVSRLPTDVIMGPHTPSRTLSKSTIHSNNLQSSHLALTVNPALNTIPLAAIPAIAIDVVRLSGNLNLSIPE